MTQDATTRKARQTSRARRNRPTLVTSQDDIQTEQPAPITDGLDEEVASTVVEAPPVRRAPRLPNFFSKVGKSEQESAAKEVEVAQARLARATRGKSVTQNSKATSSNSSTENQRTETRTVRSSSNAAANRPPSLFKTRYIVGMALYLFIAQFIGLYEKQFITNMGLERQLPTFSLFGFPITLSTSTFIFMGTLIIILVLLAKFDLIPYRLVSQNKTPQRSSSREPGEVVKRVPPPIKQGVQGADDDLYQAYRTNQRREKKR